MAVLAGAPVRILWMTPGKAWTTVVVGTLAGVVPVTADRVKGLMPEMRRSKRPSVVLTACVMVALVRFSAAERRGLRGLPCAFSPSLRWLGMRQCSRGDGVHVMDCMLTMGDQFCTPGMLQS